MPMTPDGKRLPYNEDYMEAAKKNMAPEEMPPEEGPAEEMPPEEMPPEGPSATLSLSLTPEAIEQLSDPKNKEALEKLIQDGIVAMEKGAEMMEEAMPGAAE
jgi:hypothetical protein